MAKNNLKKIREHEGISISELSRLAEVSPPTIRKIETGGEATIVTKNKIVNGLNRSPKKTKSYTYKEVFS